VVAELLTLALARALALTPRSAQSQHMRPYFDHERLKVYQSAIRFVTWSADFLAKVTAKAAAKDHLDRASTSVALNIAEGNGKFSTADRARFLEIARGSALERAACLDVLVARKLSTLERTFLLKSNSFES